MQAGRQLRMIQRGTGGTKVGCLILKSINEVSGTLEGYNSEGAGAVI